MGPIIDIVAGEGTNALVRNASSPTLSLVLSLASLNCTEDSRVENETTETDAVAGDADAEDGPSLTFSLESIAIWGDRGEFETGGSGIDQFKDPTGIALSLDELEVYVYDASNSRLKVLDRGGNTLRMWNHNPTGCGSIGYGTAITVGNDGLIYFVELGTHNVVAYSPSGDLMKSWPMNGGIDACSHGHPILVTPNDEVVIAEFGAKQIHVYSADGEFVRSFGSIGVGKGQFEFGPYGMTMREDLLYVADNFDYNSEERFLIFTVLGDFRGYLQGTRDAPLFGISTAFTAHRRWLVGISDTPDLAVLLSPSSESKFTHRWPTSQGRYEGQLRAPFGVAIAADGTWFVSEQHNNRIQLFRASIQLD